jgi:hypothetical protein
MTEKLYSGTNFASSGPGTVRVFEDVAEFPGKGRPELPPRNDLRNHSPDGFQCGYSGSGPAQLALALLADLYDDDVALEHYQAFKSDVIAGLDSGQWVLSESFIRSWADDNDK